MLTKRFIWCYFPIFYATGHRKMISCFTFSALKTTRWRFAKPLIKWSRRAGSETFHFCQRITRFTKSQDYTFRLSSLKDLTFINSKVNKYVLINPQTTLPIAELVVKQLLVQGDALQHHSNYALCSPSKLISINFHHEKKETFSITH